MTKKGFTLIEVMITVAIMTAVLLGFAQLMNVNMKAQKGVQDTSDLNSFNTVLQQVMGVSSVCGANLTLNPALIAAGGTGAVVLNVNDTADLQATNLEIDYPMPATAPATGYVPNPKNRLIRGGDTYKGWHVLADPSANHVNTNPSQGMGLQVVGPAGSNTSYYVKVIVNFQKNTDAQGNPLSMGSSVGQAVSSTITVSTTAPDGSGNVTIQGCGGSLSMDQICAAMGGTTNPTPNATPACILSLATLCSEEGGAYSPGPPPTCTGALVQPVPTTPPSSGLFLCFCNSTASIQGSNLNGRYCGGGGCAHAMCGSPMYYSCYAYP